MSAKTQWFLLAAEIVTLVLFAVVALGKVYAGDSPDSVHPSLSWLNPFDIGSTSALTAGVLTAVFIYWGWDSLWVNEETEDSERTPGVAAVVSTLLLVGIYLMVSIAAIAVHGPQFLVDNSSTCSRHSGATCFGSPLDKLLIIAVLTSASASTQTTILPSTRTALSMCATALPQAVCERSIRNYLTPGVATIWMGVLSIVWYVGLTLVSRERRSTTRSCAPVLIRLYSG